MNGREAVFILCCFWLFFFLFEKFAALIKWKVEEWKRDRGISTHFGGIWWQTNRFNGFFQFLGVKYRSFLLLWFRIGVWFGIFALIGSLLFLLWNLFIFFTNSSLSSDLPLLTPLIPGVNLPFDQLFYYFAALAISGIIHEGGHAVAGVVEKIGVESFGIFLMAIYPGAFVEFKQDFLQEEGEEELSTPNLMKKKISPFQQLKIICAGSWHNAVLAFAACILLYLLPLVLFPFYSSLDQGLMVTSLEKGSAAESRLQLGDVIIGISDCELNGLESWNKCNSYLLEPSYASKLLCIPLSSFNEHKTSELDCCNQIHWEGRQQCFSLNDQNDFQNQNVCISARVVVEESKFCTIEDEECKKDLVCLKPVIKEGEEGQVYIRVETQDKRLFAFRGSGASLWQTIGVGTWKSRRFSPFGNRIPDMLKQWLTYIVSISGALALLNMAPAFYLDGQHACSMFLQLAFTLESKRREYISWWICCITTVLLVVNILLSLLALF
eukprot:TRINITY_DN6968_c0_g1_i1.p1 TRINITY_DN6968_c0_g1~~TRINITY_DN6968_c0_g1_i1.p1  ORF type:complete len:495 (+),score=143.38 TRINITY_DN6968_c0_g1_i1:33-1517(+)